MFDSYKLIKENWPKNDAEYMIPFGLELQLADDFAFIAASEYGAGHVTVAALEASKLSAEPDGLILRLAALRVYLMVFRGLLELCWMCCKGVLGKVS